MNVKLLSKHTADRDRRTPNVFNNKCELFRSEKQVSMVQAENKKLSEPLKKAKEELQRLKGK